MIRTALAVAMIALLVPPAASAKPLIAKHIPKIRVHPKHRWHGYGFLPGYRPPEVIAAQQRKSYELRYWHYGQLQYGWGPPGFYRGRWNGGSFGPCWVSTPIGMMPTCGQ